MPNDLGLNVPGRDGRSDRPGRFYMAMLAAVIAVLLALVMMFGFGEKRASRADTGGLSAKKLEALALKFEDQKLPEAAARAWTEYLGAAGLDDKDAAQIWFRVGKLHQEATDYERAVEAYYRSEALAKVPDLETELGKRTTECLEAMGKFASLDQALVERTAITPKARARSASACSRSAARARRTSSRRSRRKSVGRPSSATRCTM